MSHFIKYYIGFTVLSALCMYCSGFGAYYFGRYFFGESDSTLASFLWVVFTFVITLHGFAGCGMRIREGREEGPPSKKIWGRTIIEGYLSSALQLILSLLVFVCAWIGAYITVKYSFLGLVEFRIIAEIPGASHVIGAIIGLLAGGSYLTLYDLESYFKPVIRGPYDDN
ncbi:MAG: hypothetical protein ACJZ89_01750 [Paracoccaceae bacterium]